KLDFGSDPFAYTTAGALWVNHSWVADLLFYSLYQIGGGLGLGLFRALLVVFLALLLVQLGRVGRSWWAPAACTALAVLAMSPWLPLQPVCLSYLLLACTLWFVHRPGRRQAGLLSCWPVLLVFVVWVNVDSWFLLGPLVLGLSALGTLLDGRRRPGAQPSAATLGLLLAAGLGVCLLNPYGIHAFRVPGQLFAPAAAVLRRDPLFQGQFTSPYETLYFTSGIALSAAGLSYFALVVLSLLSFLLNAPGWRWQRALLLAGFFALSALQARAIPFFAIVAAPVVAMNLQEFVQRRLARGVQEVATEPEWEGWMLRGRGL